MPVLELATGQSISVLMGRLLVASCTVYQIRIGVHLDRKWSTWFDGFDLIPQAEGGTLLQGAVPDQVALHAVLIKIRDLGLPLLSIQQVASQALAE